MPRWRQSKCGGTATALPTRTPKVGHRWQWAKRRQTLGRRGAGAGTPTTRKHDPLPTAGHPLHSPPSRPYVCAELAKTTEVPHRGSLLRFCAADSGALEAAFRCAAALAFARTTRGHRL